MYQTKSRRKNIDSSLMSMHKRDRARLFELGKIAQGPSDKAHEDDYVGREERTSQGLAAPLRVSLRRD
jgi:hypothetical protein